MGIFDIAVKTAIGAATGGIGGAAVGFQQGAAQNRAENERERQQNLLAERSTMFQNDPGLSSGNLGYNPASMNASPGFFAEGGALRGTLRDFGGFLGEFAPVASVFGLGDRFQRTNAGTALTINNQRPTETAQSGEILGANLGLAPALFQGARSFLRTPAGQGALGFGAGAIGAALSGGDGSAPRITRRMKSDVRRIYMMAGMDPNATAQIMNNLGTYPRMNFDASLVFFILTKRFRNDGPVVTKAAVRKTKTTLRRMKGVVDMYNSVCKPTTRRAPARRAAPKAVQLIKN